MSPSPPSPPPILRNRYRLVKWLGEGSMGVVYLARDEQLHRDVAIKFLSPGRAGSGEASSRFMREARTIARLSHPNIMTLYDVGEEGDWVYLILEHIPGNDLAAKIKAQNGPLMISETLHIMQGALYALAYAHTQGVIHRDIKPQNIMLTPNGQVKVADFGVALMQDETRLTQEGAMVGTILYMAPEVLIGVPADQRSDLYAIGVVMYELLTGKPPFGEGETLGAILSNIVHTPAPPPRTVVADIPSDLENIILKLLVKDPKGRYTTADEVLAAFPVPNKFPSIPVAEGVSPTRDTPPRSILERIVRSSTGEYRVVEEDQETPPQLDQALLVYAAMEDTTAAVEAERRRLARLLESGIIEPLNLLLAQAGIYEQSLGANPTARMAISVLTTLARQVQQQVRDLEANLHPATLETLGLEPALESLANQERRAHGLQITLTVARMQTRLPHSLELALFRVTQDALEHAIRQARAAQVTIGLEIRDGQLVYHFTHNGTVAVAIEEILGMSLQRVEQLGGGIKALASPTGGLELTIQFALTPPAELTPRELEVIQLVAEGMSNKEIAQILSISPRTVNFHLDNIYSKLGTRSRTEAAVYALRQGWVRPSAVHPG